VIEFFVGIWSDLIGAKEFWSAIGGALVGGLIAYFVQIKALREGRQIRDEDHERLRRSLGHSLLFKMIRIHSNSGLIYRHFEDSFANARKSRPEAEPWMFVVQIANPPDREKFSSDEMSLLLSLGNDDVSNAVLPMDQIYNSMIELVKVFNTSRRTLLDEFQAKEFEGTVITDTLTRD